MFYLQRIAEFFGVQLDQIRAEADGLMRLEGDVMAVIVEINGVGYDCLFTGADADLTYVFNSVSGADVRRRDESMGEFFTRIRCK